jgi:hypothetical protein
MEPDDDLFLEMIKSVTLTVLDRIGDDREVRYQFFRRFVELAREMAPGGWAEPALGHQRRQLPR